MGAAVANVNLRRAKYFLKIGENELITVSG